MHKIALMRDKCDIIDEESPKTNSKDPWHLMASMKNLFFLNKKVSLTPKHSHYFIFHGINILFPLNIFLQPFWSHIIPYETFI